MRIEFRESFSLPVEEVFSFFESPRAWVKLYGLAGQVEERGNGWIAVPLEKFPFPLVARNTAMEPERMVSWEFRGFWKGRGEVRFSMEGGRTTVEGFEEIGLRWLGPLSPVVETLLKSRFEAIWTLGWRRLRKRERPGDQND